MGTRNYSFTTDIDSKSHQKTKREMVISRQTAAIPGDLYASLVEKYFNCNE